MTILNQLVCLIEDMLAIGQSLHAYLPGRLANTNHSSTIPPNIFATCDRLDLVLVSDTEISILELTISCNSPKGFSEAQGTKEAKYAHLILNLEERGLFAL